MGAGALPPAHTKSTRQENPVPSPRKPEQASARAVPGLLRQLVIDALGGTGESLARLEIVTHERSPLKPTKRWVVEYETGPP